MPSFPRDKPPRLSTPPQFPEGMEAWGLSGKGQFRSFDHKGRMWQEIWPTVDFHDAIGRGLIAAINYGLRNKVIWDIQHQQYKSNYGTASGTCTVSGGGQTGDSLTVSGLSGTLARGDIIQIAGDTLVYDVRQASSGSTIYISPPIFPGNSPSSGATIQLTASNVWFKAVIVGVQMSDIEADGLLLPGTTVFWRETPT